MGIFKRVKTIGAADLNHTLDKYENPVSMVKQYVRELELELKKAHSALANQLHMEQKHMNLVNQVKQTISDRKRQQQLALEKGNDEMAKLAIHDRIEQEKRLKQVEQQYQDIQIQTNQLKDQIVNLKETYNDLQNRKTFLLSRANTANASQQIKRTLYSFETENILNGFARMEEKVLYLEAQINAYDYLPEKEELSTKQYSVDVEEEFQRAKEAMTETKDK